MIGPQRPPTGSHAPAIGPSLPSEAADDSDGDDFAPALPPSLVRAAPVPSEDSDDDYGPAPPPSAGQRKLEELDGAAEFEARERARQQRREEDAKPQKLKRDDWMLVPPTESDLLSSMDPTKLKRRGFSQASSAAKESKRDTTLWTETPEERARRQEDEVMGKKRKTENAVDAEADEEARIAEERKRRRDAEMRQLVDQHNKGNRAESLVDQYARTSGKEAEDKYKEQNKTWNRDRDMALGGRLMEDGKRKALMKDAAGLSGKFGGGSFL